MVQDFIASEDIIRKASDELRAITLPDGAMLMKRLSQSAEGQETFGLFYKLADQYNQKATASQREDTYEALKADLDAIIPGMPTLCTQLVRSIDAAIQKAYQHLEGAIAL